MTIERALRLIAGCFVLASVLLAAIVDTRFLWATARARERSQVHLHPVVCDFPSGRFDFPALGRARTEHGIGVVDMNIDLLRRADFGEPLSALNSAPYHLP